MTDLVKLFVLILAFKSEFYRKWKATDSDRVRPSAYPSQPDGRAPSAHESRTTTPAWSQLPFRFLGAKPSSFAPISLLAKHPVCAGGSFRTQQFHRATSRVRNLASTHPSASQNRLLGALGAVFVHGSIQAGVTCRATVGEESLRRAPRSRL